MRKYDLLFSVGIFATFLCLSMSELGSAQSRQKIPILHNACLIDPEMDHTSGLLYSDFGPFEQINRSFNKVMERSGRFRLVNKDLTRKLWRTQAGRRELKEDYEVSAFIHMSIEVDSDIIRLHLQLLSYKFEQYLVESLAVEKDDLEQASYDEIYELVAQISYRLLNRLPLDAWVTSVQGPYVTLSAGKNQGARVGDLIKVERAYIDSTHPANGTWVSFSNETLGQAQIIEVSKQTSIAKLLNLTYESSVKVGDGAMISSITGRRFFNDRKKIAKAKKPESILLPPLYPKKTKATFSEPSANKSLSAQKQSTPSLDSLQTASNSIDSVAQNKMASTSMEVIKVPEDSFSTTGAASAAPSLTQKDWYQIDFGQRMWSYSGPATTSSKLVWYLPANFMRFTNDRKFLKMIRVQGGGEVSFGKTKGRGSYSIYEGFAAIYISQNKRLLGGVADRWSGGAIGNYTGFTVKGERIGGADLVQGGVFADLYGYHSAKQLDWQTRFSLKPITIGRTGYLGRQNTIRSSLITRLDVNVFKKGINQQKGVGFFFESQTLSDSSSEVISLSNYGLQLSYKWK